MARPTIMNPHRRAIRAEQAIHAEAEDVEPCVEREGRGQAVGELIQEIPNVAPQRLRLAEAKEVERGDERAAGLRRVGLNRRLKPRIVEPDREQAHTLVMPRKRHEQRGARAQTRGERRRVARCVVDQQRGACDERRFDACPLGGAGDQRIGGKSVESEP